MNQAANGNIELITSTFTIVEVAFVAGERTKLDPSALANIDALWQPGAPIRLVEFTRFLAIEARNVVRTSMASPTAGLKSADAIHFATAIRYGSTHLYSYDKALNRYPSVKGMTCTEPPPPPLDLFTQVTS